MISEVTAGTNYYIYLKGHCEEVMITVTEEEVNPLPVGSQELPKI